MGHPRPSDSNAGTCPIMKGLASGDGWDSLWKRLGDGNIYGLLFGLNQRFPIESMQTIDALNLKLEIERRVSCLRFDHDQFLADLTSSSKKRKGTLKAIVPDWHSEGVKPIILTVEYYNQQNEKNKRAFLGRMKERKESKPWKHLLRVFCEAVNQTKLPADLDNAIQDLEDKYPKPTTDRHLNPAQKRKQMHSELLYMRGQRDLLSVEEDKEEELRIQMPSAEAQSIRIHPEGEVARNLFPTSPRAPPPPIASPHNLPPDAQSLPAPQGTGASTTPALLSRVEVEREDGRNFVIRLQSEVFWTALYSNQKTPLRIQTIDHNTIIKGTNWSFLLGQHIETWILEPSGRFQIGCRLPRILKLYVGRHWNPLPIGEITAQSTMQIQIHNIDAFAEIYGFYKQTQEARRKSIYCLTNHTTSAS